MATVLVGARVPPEMVQAVDGARAGVSRSEWLRAVIERELSNTRSDAVNGHSGPAPCPLCPVLARQVESLKSQVRLLEDAHGIAVMLPLDELGEDEWDG